MHGRFLLVLILAGFMGCSGDNGSALVPIPTGTLPATRISDVLPSAGGQAEYRNMVEVAFTRYSDANANVFSATYTLYLEDVDNGPTPIGLHDFLQHENCLRAEYSDLDGTSLLGFGARYMVQDMLPLRAGIEFAEDYFSLTIGSDYYFSEEMAAGLDVTFSDFNNVDINSVYPHFKWAVNVEGGGSLFLEAGFRINGGDVAVDDGVYVEVEYYFDRHVSAGIRFTTDDDQFIGFGNYRLENGLGFGAEIGGVNNDTVFTLNAEYRF
ncbi:MAG: hypothetical protein JW909_03860 [Planctomycetes bacterium]|nr:hypothetical protein [Planctomycetota bacterium]